MPEIVLFIYSFVLALVTFATSKHRTARRFANALFVFVIVEVLGSVSLYLLSASMNAIERPDNALGAIITVAVIVTFFLVLSVVALSLGWLLRRTGLIEEISAEEIDSGFWGGVRYAFYEDLRKVLTVAIIIGIPVIIWFVANYSGAGFAFILHSLFG